MLLYQDVTQSEPHDCPYIKQTSQESFFLAKWVDGDELDILFNQGWRRFSYYYFKPSCLTCEKCTPIRVPIADFKASKNQRKILNKQIKQFPEFRVEFNEKQYREEIYHIYKSHNTRFTQACDTEEAFINAHFNDTCDSIQSEYYLGDQLIAVGFIDVTDNALSSSYFIYHTDFQHLNLGTLSVLKEIEYSKKEGKEFYHLGYWIEDNVSMAYKNKFFPHELMNWHTGEWTLQQKIKIKTIE